MRYKKVISKVIKMNDLRNKDIEHVKDKCLEYWEVVDIDIRDVFSYILYSKLKYIVGFNPCRERIEKIDKNKKIDFYLYYYESKN